MTTYTIPGVDRDDLADAILRGAWIGVWSANRAADAALAYIAEHHKRTLPTCTCGAKYDQCPSCAADEAYEMGRKDAACEQDDEWVEVDRETWIGLPDGVRVRSEWVRGSNGDGRSRQFAHRDDLPDPDKEDIERMAKAIFAFDYPIDEWESRREYVREAYRENARAALAAYREGKQHTRKDA